MRNEAIEQEENREYYKHLINEKFNIKRVEIPNNYEEKISELSVVLGSGELEVIILALQKKGTVVIDDLKARNFARKLGIRVIDTLGILEIAVSKKWISDKESIEIIQKLLSGGFRIPPIQDGQIFEEYLLSLNK